MCGSKCTNGSRLPPMTSCRINTSTCLRRNAEHRLAYVALTNDCVYELLKGQLWGSGDAEWLWMTKQALSCDM